jgi:hypothetical protein
MCDNAPFQKSGLNRKIHCCLNSKKKRNMFKAGVPPVAGWMSVAVILESGLKQ